MGGGGSKAANQAVTSSEDAGNGAIA